MSQIAAVRAVLLAVAFLVLSCRISSATESDAPTSPPVAPAESHYCARAGESAEQRVERLEVALRLARAEVRVNSKRKAKR
jgi:hypothetical protein